MVTTVNLRICVLAACLLVASQTYAGYTMEEMCAQWWDKGYVGNPTDCQGWGYCLGQKLVSWGSCAENETFNAQLGICDWSYRTPCKTNPVETCKVATTFMYVADPDDCNQYYNCDGKGNMQVFSCGTGAVFFASVPKCDWGPTCPQDSICEYMKNDIIVGDPENCGQYISCFKGAGTPGTCTNGTTYNLQTGSCQSTNACDSSNSGTATDGQFSVGDTSDTACQNGWANAKEVTGPGAYRFVPDNSTCYGFYYCATESSIGIWNSCPTGTHFNPKSGLCVSPATYACPHNRCGNVDALFMATVNSECLIYQYCAKDGYRYMCPPTHPYYDEVHNLCTFGNLTYAVCTEQVEV
ncbi:peritrophin-44-like [Drosophila bipectinata]|uniref:peritrophin-44-like n=1 Tax=Drosophila bipectinata TaxID=42026 RepID=UPI001C8AA33A|nr:peritrophin-44-like [Drosophila bipectinata]